MKTHISSSSANGTNVVHATIWIPNGEIKAILLISHGMQEFIERYDHFANYLNEAGIVVAGNDHIGHGRSVNDTDEWGYFGKSRALSALSDDMYTLCLFMKEEYPEIPCFLLGHSMGSFVARRFMIEHSESIDGCIVMGTGHKSSLMLKPGIMLTRLVKLFKGEKHRSEFLKNTAFSGYLSKIENPKSQSDWLTHDESVVEWYDNTPACTYTFTVNGYENLFEGIAYVKNKENVARIRKDIPVLVISGDEDPVGGYGKEVKAAFKQLKQAGIIDCKICLVKKARHEILNELNKEKTYKVLLNWLESHYCK